MTRPIKITFGEMRDTGVRGILIYCSDYKCSHSLAIGADPWPDHVRLSDLEGRFICKACGKRGADIRPLFDREGMIPDTLSVKLYTIFACLVQTCSRWGIQLEYPL